MTSETFDLKDCKGVIHIVGEKAYLNIELPDGRDITFSSTHICYPSRKSTVNQKETEQ